MPKRVQKEFWHLGSYKYPFYRFKFQTLYEHYVRKSYSVLDAGCGDNGGYILRMSTNAQGVGLDIKRENIKKSVRKSKDLQLHNLSFLVGDLEKIPFRKNQFNVIVSCDVIEHVKKPENVISELAFCLKKGGKLLICTTNLFNPAMLIDLILPKKVSNAIVRRFGASHYERTYRFNPWNLADRLRKCGLVIEKLYMFGYPPFGRPWIYEYRISSPPKISYFWIIFNKITNFSFLDRFKEEILITAKKGF